MAGTPITTFSDKLYDIGLFCNSEPHLRTIVGFEEVNEKSTTSQEIDCFLANIQRNNCAFKTEHGYYEADEYSTRIPWPRRRLTLDSLDWIPEGYTFPQDNRIPRFEYVVRLQPDQELSRLPAGVTVGQLDASGNRARTLPENLTCEVLDISNSMVEELPRSLRCENVFANNSALKRVETEQIDYTFEARNCKYLKQMPKMFSCKHIHVAESALEQLPSQLVCDVLDLCKSKVKNLPDGLKLKRLNLSYCYDCHQIPNGTKVSGTLLLDYSGVTHIGDDVVVDGEMNLERTKVESVGKGCQVNCITFSGFMDKMPENLQAQTMHKGPSQIESLKD